MRSLVGLVLALAVLVPGAPVEGTLPSSPAQVEAPDLPSRAAAAASDAGSASLRVGPSATTQLPARLGVLVAHRGAAGPAAASTLRDRRPDVRRSHPGQRLPRLRDDVDDP